jgi:RHS repeat-associated protein
VAALTGDPVNGVVPVVERYKYDAYGRQTITSDGGVARSKSAVGFDRGFTGYQVSGEVGLLYARARMYSPTLGRFIGRDPLQYINGTSLYQGYFVPNSIDPTGTEYVTYVDRISDLITESAGQTDSYEEEWVRNEEGPCLPCLPCDVFGYSEWADVYKKTHYVTNKYIQYYRTEYGIINMTLKGYYEGVFGFPGYLIDAGVGAGDIGAYLSRSVVAGQAAILASEFLIIFNGVTYLFEKDSKEKLGNSVEFVRSYEEKWTYGATEIRKNVRKVTCVCPGK